MRFEEHRVILTQKTFVFNAEGKILVLFRTETAPTRPLSWDLPGGVYERGEDPEQAARREIQEEAGITVKNIAPIELRKASNEKDEQWVRVAYKAQAEMDEVTLSFEHSEYKWVTIEEFLTLNCAQSWLDIARKHFL